MNLTLMTFVLIEQCHGTNCKITHIISVVVVAC